MSGPFTVTIPAAKMGRASLSTEIFSDDVFEDDESFSLAINQSSLPSNVVAGNLSQVEITIEDDSGKLIYIVVVVIAIIVFNFIVVVALLLLLLLLFLLLFYCWFKVAQNSS